MASMSGHSVPQVAQMVHVCIGVSTSSTTSDTSTKFCFCSAPMFSRSSEITPCNRHACCANPVRVIEPPCSASSSSLRTPESVPLPMDRKSTSVATGDEPCNISASAVSFFRRSNSACSFPLWAFHSCTICARCASDKSKLRATLCARLNTLRVCPGPAVDTSDSGLVNACAEEHALPSTRYVRNCRDKRSAMRFISLSLASPAFALSSTSAASRCSAAHGAQSPGGGAIGGTWPAELAGLALRRSSSTSTPFLLAHSRSASRVCASLASAYSFICRMSNLSCSIVCHRCWHSSRPMSERCSDACRRALSAVAASAFARSASTSASRLVTCVLWRSRHRLCACRFASRWRLRRCSASAASSSSEPLLDTREARLVFFPLAGFLGGSAAPRANAAGSAGRPSGAAPTGTCAPGGASMSIAGNGLVCISGALKCATPNDGCSCSEPPGERPSPAPNTAGPTPPSMMSVRNSCITKSSTSPTVRAMFANSEVWRNEFCLCGRTFSTMVALVPDRSQGTHAQSRQQRGFSRVRSAGSHA
mmetsp:Transcript_10023/g.42133  ORF Transcript_10023/g.42133 Transcript_10023/m.42133 type:complete len:535 (+) Transcript_10023:994-2598(+)